MNQDQPQKSNRIGTAGFLFAIIAVFLGKWFPFVGWIVCLLGLIFSFVGVFKRPKGMAIAGLVISSIELVLLICLSEAFFSMGAAAS